MLSVAPGSACDVCLDPFGPDDKAPCSIQCGHVFCEACLNNIDRASCPLCRMYFDQRAIVKLHVDLDGSTSDPSSGPSARQEARRLQMAIASVANEGTTEPRLRHLIAEATAFLASQPRESFSELRISHRMIAYLCDIKTKLRSQKSELEKLNMETSQLKDERGELQQQIDKLNTIRKDEKETALVVEMSLRDHCARAHATYAQLADRVSGTFSAVNGELIYSEQHAYVMKQWTTLTAKIGGLDLGKTLVLNAQSDTQPADTRFLLSDIASPLDPDETANLNPDSLLISPLPQFTSGLPGSFSDLRPFPDPGSQPETPYRQSSICTSPDHPTSCPCIDIPPFPEMPLSTVSSLGRSASSVTRPISARSERSNDLLSLPPTPERELSPSPGDRDILRYGIQRSSSRSSRLSSRSHPSSEFASHPPSPRRSASSTQAHSRIPSPLDKCLPTSAIPSAPVISRLHELMETPSVSSSLPNMSSSHFPSSITHRSQQMHRSRSPSRSRSASLHSIPPPQQSRGIRSEAIDAAAIVVKFPPLHDSSSFSSSSGPVSSASTAAMALERAQREQRERLRAEKEQERERRSSNKEREQSERDRPRVDMERARGHQITNATSHRDPTKVYPSMPVPFGYLSHWNHSSRSGISASRDSYSAHNHAAKTTPIMSTARV